MSDTIEYRPLPISTEDLLRPKAAVQDRDRNRRLDLLRTDLLPREVAEGLVEETHIMVTIKGVDAPLFTVRHSETETAKPCWLVHHPSDRPLCEFPAIVDVANFLAFGDARLCKRSWMTGRSEPGLIVAGDLPAVTRKGAPEAAPGWRGRYLPMLGDRAGEGA